MTQPSAAAPATPAEVLARRPNNLALLPDVEFILTDEFEELGVGEPVGAEARRARRFSHGGKTDGTRI